MRCRKKVCVPYLCKQVVSLRASETVGLHRRWLCVCVCMLAQLMEWRSFRRMPCQTLKSSFWAIMCCAVWCVKPAKRFRISRVQWIFHIFKLLYIRKSSLVAFRLYLHVVTVDMLYLLKRTKVTKMRGGMQFSSLFFVVFFGLVVEVEQATSSKSMERNKVC